MALDLQQIKGIIFDYGGTIDSNGKHWGEVLWEAYQRAELPISKDHFREAYVYAERYLAVNPVIAPEDDFLRLLEKKLALHQQFLVDKGYLRAEDFPHFVSELSQACNHFSQTLIDNEREILTQLKQKYPIVLVSNFYGNIHSVLASYKLDTIFEDIVESAVVGIRKPDPAIFALGVQRINLPAENVVVIGDSYKKDIVPARANGCKTIWLKGKGWEPDPEDATADVVIEDFRQLKNIFQL